MVLRQVSPGLTIDDNEEKHLFPLTPRWPTPVEDDFVIENFRFTEGRELPILRLHYRTVGQLKKDDNGKASNAVLIMHGTTGSGAHVCGQSYEP